MTGNELSHAVRGVRWGVLLSLAAVAFGFGLGGVFGGMEDALKGDLKSRAEAVLDSAYGGDRAKMTATVDKAWAYYKRAHLHGGAIGTAALAAALLLAAMTKPARMLRAITAAAMGLGALGYSIYWLIAGYRAVEMGSTTAAKDSLEWLAVPTAGLAIIGLAMVLAMAAWEWLTPPRTVQ